jgi:DNA-binding response OmpR family regulator
MANLLIVEPPGAFRDALLTTLARHGHAARAADDVPAAAAELLVEPADLVVLGRGAAAAAAADMAADPRCAWLRGVAFVVITDDDQGDDAAAAAEAAGLDVRGRVRGAEFTLARLLGLVEAALRPAWDEGRGDSTRRRTPPGGGG